MKQNNMTYSFSFGTELQSDQGLENSFGTFHRLSCAQYRRCGKGIRLAAGYGGCAQPGCAPRKDYQRRLQCDSVQKRPFPLGNFRVRNLSFDAITLKPYTLNGNTEIEYDANSARYMPTITAEGPMVVGSHHTSESPFPQDVYGRRFAYLYLR